jgi:hypothetical protein
MSIDILIVNFALCFFAVGGLAAWSGRSWQKWTALALLVTPLLALPVLLAAIIIHAPRREVLR